MRHKGFKHSIETRLKMREKALGKRHTLKSRLKIKLARSKQIISHSLKTRLKISNAHKGKQITDIHRDNLRKSHIGLKQTDVTRQKKREYVLNHPIRVYKSTSIEIKIEEELKRRGMLYEKQVPLCKVAVVDFFLRELNIVIQADGCYWHGCPEHFPLYPKGREKDLIQNKKLIEAGYKVFRFWGSEINLSPKDCVDKVFVV